MSTDLTDLSASELSKGIPTKKVSCVDVIQAYLAKINKYNPVYNAIVLLGKRQWNNLMKGSKWVQ